MPIRFGARSIGTAAWITGWTIVVACSGKVTTSNGTSSGAAGTPDVGSTGTDAVGAAGASTGTNTNSSDAATGTTGPGTGSSGPSTSTGVSTGSSGPRTAVAATSSAGTYAPVTTGAGGAAAESDAGSAGGASTNSLLSVTVSPSSNVLTLGASEQLVATALYSNGGASDVTTGRATWSVDNRTLATVLNGRVVALAPGTVQVTASLGGVSGQALVTIPALALTAIAIAPDPASAAVGGAARLTATGTYEDGSTSDVTAGARWTVDDRSIAAITLSFAVDAAIVTGVAPGKTMTHALVGRPGGPTTQGSAAVTITP